jgi:hypothetical protein
MPTAPERAPRCGHRFMVVNVRGDQHMARTIITDLRRAFRTDCYVSDVYESRDGVVFAICGECAAA